MNAYYLLSGEDSHESVFFEATKIGFPVYELAEAIEGLEELPFTFSLRKVRKGRSGLVFSDDLSSLHELWLDLPPNSFALPLMSERAKSLIDRELTGNEGVEWVKSIVTYQDVSHRYYVPRFRAKLDVLDIGQTIFVPNTDHIIKPVFSFEKIRNLSVFHVPSQRWPIPSVLYINDAVRSILLENKITGASFESLSESRITR